MDTTYFIESLKSLICSKRNTVDTFYIIKKLEIDLYIIDFWIFLIIPLTWSFKSWSRKKKPYF